MNSSVMQTGSQLLQLAAQPTLQLAAATRSTSSQQQRLGTGSTLGPDDLQEGLESQLLRVPGMLHRNMVSAGIFIANLFSTQQLAVLLVACYARGPIIFGVANLVHKRVQQRQQALLSAVDHSARVNGTVPVQFLGLPEADLIALCCRGPSSIAMAKKTGGEGEPHSSTSVARYMLQEHEQQRMARLLRHQSVCWEELGCQPLQETG
jgi:hypothetical protein